MGAILMRKCAIIYVYARALWAFVCFILCGFPRVNYENLKVIYYRYTFVKHINSAQVRQFHGQMLTASISSFNRRLTSCVFAEGSFWEIPYVIEIYYLLCIPNCTIRCSYFDKMIIIRHFYMGQLIKKDLDVAQMLL